MKKVIDTILDVLLVIGAIASIFTIGGGRWMLEGMNTEDAGMLVPVTGEVSPLYEGPNTNNSYQQATPTVRATEEGSTEAGYPCPMFPLTGSADWSNAHLFRSQYFEYVKEHGEPAETVAGRSAGARSLDCR